MKIFSAALLTAGTLATGSFAYWTNKKSAHLPDEKKGSLLLRMQEAAIALYTSQKIKDVHTAKNHLETVATLSSPPSTSADTERLESEIKNLRSTYFSGYLLDILQNSAPMNSAIFDYNENLNVDRFCPKHSTYAPDSDEPYKGFIFSGPIENVHNPKSREDILKGNYVRCPSSVHVKTRDTGYEKATYKQVPTLITGTTETARCNDLAHAILVDATMIASKFYGIDPNNPLSDTPVFDWDDEGWTRVGDLSSNLPGIVKAKIHDRKFTLCEPHAREKTRLSPNEEKLCPAVVAGTTDQIACLHIRCSKLQKPPKKIEEKPTKAA